MNTEPSHRTYGVTVSEWIAKTPAELADDAVGLWHIAKMGSSDSALKAKHWSTSVGVPWPNSSSRAHSPSTGPQASALGGRKPATESCQRKLPPMSWPNGRLLAKTQMSVACGSRCPEGRSWPQADFSTPPLISAALRARSAKQAIGYGAGGEAYQHIGIRGGRSA